MRRVAIPFVVLCVLALSSSLSADIRSDQRVKFQLGGALGKMVNLFSKGAREGVTTTVAVKGNRKATMNGDSTGQIIDLSEEKIYDLDLKKKTYKVTTFEELRRRMAEAQRKAEEDARKQQPKDPQTTPDANTSAKEMDVDFTVNETGQKKAINGYDTRQVIMTVSVREKGRTLEESGGLVLTADTWLGPTIEAMKELAEFDVRYARQIAGPMVAGASAEEMAAALAMYPGLKDAMTRMRTEGVKLEGTAILSTVTVDAVKSAEQLAQEQKQSEQSGSSSSSSASGIVGGLMRRAVVKKEEAKSRVTFMTTTNEILRVTTDVAAADVAVPTGFKESK